MLCRSLPGSSGPTFRQAARSRATSSFRPSQPISGQAESRLLGGRLQSYHRPALCSGSRCSMARARKPDEAQQAGGSVSGYFKALFKENPSLVTSTSNDDIFARWLKDHPGEKEVPDRVKGILFNVKSKLRKKLGAKRGRPRKEEQPTVEGQTAEIAPTRRVPPRGLESLEERIDDCLTLARSIPARAASDTLTGVKVGEPSLAVVVDDVRPGRAAPAG